MSEPKLKRFCPFF